MKKTQEEEHTVRGTIIRFFFPTSSRLPSSGSSGSTYSSISRSPGDDVVVYCIDGGLGVGSGAGRDDCTGSTGTRSQAAVRQLDMT